MRFGQGFLFSPPRPVRAESLSGVSDAVAKAGESEASDAGAGAASEPVKAFAARA